jgi:hypothetical protein
MSAPSFDPTLAVRFDLLKGSVRAGWPEDRVVLVPAAALGEALRAAPAAAVDALGAAIGAGVGRRAAARMLDPQASSLEEFATQIAGEAALAGLGKIVVERWGRALVLAFDDFPLPIAIVSAVASSAVEAALGRKVWAVLLAHEAHAARVLLTSEGAAGRVRGWIAGGMAWGDALVKLHEGAS